MAKQVGGTGKLGIMLRVNTSESEDGMSRVIFALILCLVFVGSATAAKLRAGASAVDITPTEFPVIVNGMFEERIATKALDPIFAKCIVLDDGTTRIAMVVADSCMLPRDLLDEAKSIASKSTGIPTDRMMISATHTHSAPSSMGCLGSDPDVKYQRFVVPLLAKAIEQANANLRPAKVGWAVAKAPDYTACRRWIFAASQMRNDPFGSLTVRANMHPGYQNAAAMGPAGPTDPDLTMLAVQDTEGKPLALLANFSMHYFGSGIVSADYFGIFAKKFAALASADENFVGIMSQGTSGDAWWGDYSKPAAKKWTIDEYSEGLARIAFEAYRGIEYRDEAPLAMEELKMKSRYRVPDEKRLAWAKERMAALNGKKPAAQPDIYAREQIFLAEHPERELKLQAIRIGEFGIAAIPNEVFALSGLKIKGQSPLKPTMVIELANGAEGYIPPPEQHFLGGYTTWAARTAGLESKAEWLIVENMTLMLHRLARLRVPGLTQEVYVWMPRQWLTEQPGPYAQTVLSSQPAAYFRMAQEQLPLPAFDDIRKEQHGEYEPGVVFYLEGPAGQFTPEGQINRCPHFAGGR
ncbi:MAG TPA: hypothetical protein VGP99_00385, partial [Tepidisphaeraceae bacterium]|nr:hypothetical protein [Tepidisphaeraceae bacterium]